MRNWYRAKVQEVITMPALLNSSEYWAAKRRDKSIQATKTRFLTATMRCTRKDHICTRDIRKTVKIFSVVINWEYRQTLMNHVDSSTVASSKLLKGICWKSEPANDQKQGEKWIETGHLDLSSWDYSENTQPKPCYAMTWIIWKFKTS